MRKLALALPAALAAVLVAVALSAGSSHREAPNTALDPSADDTDVYAYTANDAPGSLTVVADWIPFEDPAGGPNFYRFDDRAHYYINIDNTGDGKYDIRYLFKFTTTVRNKNSFLYALPGVSSINDPKLNVVQTYDIVREKYNKNGKKTSQKTIAHGLPVAPNNAGPKTFPNYDSVANAAIRNLSGGGKVFAGQRDDPFFVDLGVTFDAINFRPGTGTGNQGGGKDDLAGYNTHSIVLQVPESKVTRDGKAVSGPSAKNAVVGVWSSTERRRLQVTAAAKNGGNGWVQVSRLGNPLVNEVVIPLGKKDQFNRTQPSQDAPLYGKYVLKPELAHVMNVLFNIGAPETNRTDIVQAVLQGIPGLNQVQGKGAKEPAVDTLKLNLGTPPSNSPNRFGVLAGDNAGYPNGRRLIDDVVDIDLRVFAGFLKNHKVALGDGVDKNDVPFLSTFPYVAPPHSGFDSQLKRIEPPHPPTRAPPAARGSADRAGPRPGGPSRPPSHERDPPMTLRIPHLRPFAAMLAAFGVAVLVLTLVNRTPAPTAPASSDTASAGVPRTTDAVIATFQRALRAHPGDVAARTDLADAYLQKVRETGDPSFYPRAGALVQAALRRAPGDPAALTVAGTLALARHDFHEGLRLGQAALRGSPGSVRPLAVVVDAEVELGRYADAGRTLQRMVDLKPSLSSYARASYYRELHGDLAGASAAMGLAVDAGGQAPENVAYVQTLLGTLELDRGRLDDARLAYATALVRQPGFPAADAGLARVEAARGNLPAAIRRYRRVVARLPLPEYVIGLGEAELAAGRAGAGRRDLALVGAEESLLAAAGVNTDVDLALYEASHGSPSRAVTLGRRAYAAAPSVRAADALGWALTRAGRPASGLAYARRALRLGSRDPLFLFHAGIAARGAGRTAQARRLLAASLSLNPHFSPFWAPRARQALRSLP
jgi:tetratricopeptide (TPR) repeat protein